MGEVILLGRTQCQLGLTKAQRRGEKKRLLRAAYERSLNLSGLSRAFAQAWSEVENIRTERRSTNCCTEAGRRLEAVDADASIIEDRIQKARDFSPLLENNLDAVRRQSDERKRI
jgi:hypothetical protein